MTAPDGPPDRLTAAANEVGAQIHRLVLEAHTHGFRNGLEGAARYCEEIAARTAENYELDAGVRDFAVAIVQEVRDRLRLIVHEVPDPASAT